MSGKFRMPFYLSLLSFTLCALSSPLRAASLELASVSVLGSQRTFLSVEGAIEQGDWWRFTKAMKAHPEVTGILLSSDGGALDDGLAIAKHIHKNQLDTMVTGECHSVCTVMFLSGTDRYISSAAHLTMHSAYRELNGWTVEDDDGNVRVAWFMGEMGYPLKLAQMWAATTSDSEVPVTQETNVKLKLNFVYLD